uniref:Uncharacterized protein n=1 Tax=Rhizophagus irregularis (strain DAOM 181602 / DAOM 197198 / MUCL 43194) TaxID=747089 RepID=U9UAR2_RHIID
MSILNLALQGVALKREDMSGLSEQAFEKLKTLSEIREGSILTAESQLTINDTTLVELRKFHKLKEFIDTHCQIRQYSFQQKSAEGSFHDYYIAGQLEADNLPQGIFNNNRVREFDVIFVENSMHFII